MIATKLHVLYINKLEIMKDPTGRHVETFVAMK